VVTERTSNGRRQSRKQKPPITIQTINILSELVAFTFTATEWSAIVSTSPNPLPKGADLKAARIELQDAATVYLAGRHWPKKLRAGLPAWRKTCKSIERALEHAEKQRQDKIAVESPELDKIVAGLRDLSQIARSLLLPLMAMSGDRRGTRDSSRDRLYSSALSLWTKMGGELKFSRPSGGAKSTRPGGPTIRFLEIALKPILKDEMP
jgi:hypothetical protein